MHSFGGTVEFKTFAEGIRMIQNAIKEIAVLRDKPYQLQTQLLMVPTVVNLQRIVVK
jgi:hypothetical protein